MRRIKDCTKKLTIMILVVSLLCSLLSFGVQKTYSADNLDEHTVENYKKVGNFTELTESYSMSGGVVTAASANFASTYIRGKANMAIYKIPLPIYHPSLDIDRFILRFGHGKKADYKIMKIDFGEWDFSELPMSVPLNDPRLAPMISASYNTAFDANDAPIIDVETAVTDMYVSYADISSYAREAFENKQTHFYVAVGSWNSTHNISLSSMKDVTYRKENVHPGIYYNFKSPYPEEKTSYPKITHEDFETMIPKTVEGGHPWLFGRKADFERIREYAFGKDPVMTEMYRKFKDDATVYVDKAVSKITTDIVENSYMSRAQDAMEIILSCAFIYMVEGESAKDYADRAVAEAMYFAEEMETWGRAQSLDVNLAATGIAICYDWLYDYMTEEQRTKVAGAMFEKHLNEVYDFFNNPTDPKYKYSFHQQYLGYSNHAMLDNSSVFVQALAVADVNAQKSASIMALSLEHLSRHNGPFDHLYPDSGWYEGSSYWALVGPPMAKMFSAMKSAFGSCLGFEDNAYITGTGYFPIYTQSSNTRLMYSDGYAGKTLVSEFYWYGLMGGDEALQNYCLENKYFSNPLLCLWYNPEDSRDGELKLSKDKLFRGIDVASMRSSWDNPWELFAGMAVQKPQMSHGFMAMGTLMLDALGETWITNPGKEVYSIGNYWDNGQNGVRWTYYSTRAEANSCVVINPSEDGGQIVKSPAMIDRFESSDGAALMVTDLTTAYADAKSYKRGVKMFDNRSKVMVQDEISLEKPSDVYSFINVYQSDIEIADDGSHAILSKGKKHIYVKVISDKPYTLTTLEACSEALGTSPVPEAVQTDFTKDFQRLAVKYDDVSGDVNLTFVFVPYVLDNVPDADVVQTPIAQWTVNESAPDKPVLKSLLVNGEPIENFCSDVAYYKIPLKYFEADIKAVADNATVEIKNNYRENIYEIFLTDKTTGAKNHYCVEVVLSGEITADSYVGGSLSDETYHLKFNYGAQEAVRLRVMGRYSLMGYYKMNLPYIPAGKTVKSASFILNQYRFTNSSIKDAYEFHLVNPSSWQENTITYYNAPVRQTYTENWYPYRKSDTPGIENKNSYTTESIPDLTLKNLEIKTVPSRYSDNDRFFEEHSYDITPLVEKSDFSSYHKDNNLFSFAMGHVVLTTYSSSSRTVIASKDNPNEDLHPKLFVELENDPNETRLMAEKGKIVVNPLGNELYFTSQNQTPSKGERFSAVTYVVNLSGEQKELKVFVAQYDAKGKMIALNSHCANVLPGEALTVRTPAYTALSGVASVKVFTWKDGITPANFN